MSNVRAAKSGFALEAQRKMEAKYDVDQAAQMMGWIQIYVKDVPFSTDGSMDNVKETLSDGFILNKLIKELNTKLGAGSTKEPKRAKMPFQKMEAINMFLQAIEKDPYNVTKTELFQTCDLYEATNLSTVITCLASLSRKCKAKGLEGYGPKEAEQNKRDFTEEQMKAGAGVIGLQMGSNKGATQAGQSFGKGRGIYDTKADV